MMSGDRGQREGEAHESDRPVHGHPDDFRWHRRHGESDRDWAAHCQQRLKSVTLRALLYEIDVCASMRTLGRDNALFEGLSYPSLEHDIALLKMAFKMLGRIADLTEHRLKDFETQLRASRSDSGGTSER